MLCKGEFSSKSFRDSLSLRLARSTGNLQKETSRSKNKTQRRRITPKKWAGTPNLMDYCTIQHCIENATAGELWKYYQAAWLLRAVSQIPYLIGHLIDASIHPITPSSAKIYALNRISITQMWEDLVRERKLPHPSVDIYVKLAKILLQRHSQWHSQHNLVAIEEAMEDRCHILIAISVLEDQAEPGLS